MAKPLGLIAEGLFLCRGAGQPRLSEWMLTKDEGAASDAGADKECE
jgi:hypothetical protein